VLYYSKKMTYITNFFKNSRVIFNSATTYHFESYIGFQYYAVSSLNSLAFQFLNKITKFPLSVKIFKSKRKKLYNSQLRFWLNDFYIDRKNFSSKFSSTMVQCSKLSRLNSTNFKF